MLGLPVPPKPVKQLPKPSIWDDVKVTTAVKPKQVLKGEDLKKFRAEEKYNKAMRKLNRQSFNRSKTATKHGRGNKPQVVPIEVKVPLEAKLPGKDALEPVIVKVKTKRNKLIVHRKQG